MKTSRPVEGAKEAPKQDLGISSEPSTPSRRALLVLLFVGAVAGSVFATWLQTKAVASRNSSGTYSLPSGNPVVTGTTITSSWANNTLSDLSTEITNSLDRAGRGGMTAPLQHSAGTISLPSLTFVAETNSGIYRAGSNDLRFAVAGTDILQWLTSGVVVTGKTSGTSAGNSDATAFTGAGAGAGLVGTGGGTSGSGASGTGGAPNGKGVVGQGTGTGAGGAFTGGGTSGDGIDGTGGTPNGVGIVGLGTGTGPGVKGTGSGTAVGGQFSNGTAATGATRQNAVQLQNGDLYMGGVVNPNSTVGLANTLTPSNIPKSWATICFNAGVPSVSSGFNVASVALIAAGIANGGLRVTFATAMANASYAVMATPGASLGGSTAAAIEPQENVTATTSFVLLWMEGSTQLAWNTATSPACLYVLVFGNQ